MLRGNLAALRGLFVQTVRETVSFFKTRIFVERSYACFTIMCRNKGSTQAGTAVWQLDNTLIKLTCHEYALADATVACVEMGEDIRLQQNEAIEYYREKLRQAPNNPGYHHNMAPLLLAQGHVRSAIHHYRRAFQLNPSDINSKNDLAMVLWRMRKWEAALALLCQVVAVNNNHFEGHLNLATVYYSKGQCDLAVFHAKKAAHIRPGNAMVHRTLGQIFDQMGNSEKSMYHRKIAIRRGPGVGGVFHPHDTALYRKLGAQIVSRASEDKDSGHPFMDAYRALCGKRVELANSVRTTEILQKCFR